MWTGMKITGAIRHNILEFCERKLATLGVGAAKKKMTIIDVCLFMEFKT